MKAAFVLRDRKYRPGSGIIEIKGRDYIYSGTNRFLCLEKRDKWKPPEKPNPKDCRHPQWLQAERVSYGKVIPISLHCISCGETCPTEDKLKAHQLGIIKVRIVVAPPLRHPRTKENRQWFLQRMRTKYKLGKWKKKKCYRLWLRLSGRTSTPKRWKKFLRLLLKK